MNRLERGAIPAEILLRRAKVLLRHADLLRELGDFPDALREVGVRGLKLAAEVCVLPPELGCLVGQLRTLCWRDEISRGASGARRVRSRTVRRTGFGAAGSSRGWGSAHRPPLAAAALTRCMARDPGSRTLVPSEL